MYRYIHIHTYIQTDRQTDRHTHTCIQTCIGTCIHIGPCSESLQQATPSVFMARAYRVTTQHSRSLLCTDLCCNCFGCAKYKRCKT